jgi:hypothetical protein
MAVMGCSNRRIIYLFSVLVMRSNIDKYSIVIFVRGLGFIVISFMCILVLCEGYFRFPFIAQRLEYQIDNDLIAVLKPDQIGFVWQGNMSYKSPIIKINRDGFRGDEINWNKPTLVCFGNSEAFGSGVRDSEVWTSVLQNKINNRYEKKSLNIANASHPGHGPYDHYIRIKRVLDSHSLDGIIVRVDIADRYFQKPPPEKKAKMLKKATMRQQIRIYTKGLPYLFNKLTAQLPSIKKCFYPRFMKTKKGSANLRQAGQKMWIENKKWWERIIELAVDNKVPLLFFMVDPNNSEGNYELESGLKQLIRNNTNTYLLRLGPEHFGLFGGTQEDRHREISAKLTLGRDPHANSTQHRMIADGLYTFMQNYKIFVRIKK